MGRMATEEKRMVDGIHAHWGRVAKKGGRRIANEALFKVGELKTPFTGRIVFMPFGIQRVDNGVYLGENKQGRGKSRNRFTWVEHGKTAGLSMRTTYSFDY